MTDLVPGTEIEPPPPGEGRLVERTFLIADVRGYTRFTRERGDAEAARLAKRFADVARDAVEARSGRVTELRGDEVLAVFESPAQAVRAAVELQAVCAEEVAADPSLPLFVGAGVDLGEAVPVEDGFRGAALNTAARLCSQAAAGQVLVTSAVADRAGEITDVGYAPGGTAELKGFESPVELIEVVTEERPRPPELAAAFLEPLPIELEPDAPVAGRGLELAWLRGTWRQARRGYGRIVFVSGPAQIGKSRLASELASFAAANGAAVSYAGAGGTAAAQAASALREAVADGRPTLVVLDDLDVTAEAIAPVAAELFDAIEAAPTMVVGLVRDPDVSPALAELIARADQRGDGHRRLGPLDVEGVREIASLYAGDEIQEVPLESITRASGGVPGRVHEVMSEWAEQEATRRLAAAAEFLAAERRERTADLEFANNVIGLKLARLYGGDEAPAGTDAGACPYKGLASFEEDDAALFFGRERLVGELAARTVGAGLLAVVGASGSGKSSVIAAGLLPSLRAGLLPGSDRWRSAVIRPGEHPLAELESVRAEDQGNGRLVLVIDQFEEVFTVCHDEDERSRFVESLISLAADLERTVLVLGLRGDYYGHCGAYPELARLLAQNQVLVGPMSADELRRAVELPARRAGLRVESALGQAVVAEIGDEPGGLPLLSTALVELWVARSDGWLRLETHERLGGVRGAVARLAESSYENLQDGQRAAGRRLFLRLVATGEEGAVARRRVSLSELDLDRDPVLASVVDRLTDDRLLTAYDGSVEVAHEALLREWPRFQEWLAEDAQGRELREHLTQSARRWQEQGRDAADLYRGARLSATLDWAAARQQELNELEREFLAESRTESERELARQRRTNRRLKGLLAGVGVLLLAAIAAGAFALVQRFDAQHKAKVALAQSLGAQAVSEPHIDLAMLLAREAVALNPSLRTRTDLLTTLLRVPTALRTYHWNANRNGSVAVSPDGRTIAIEDNNGKTVVEDAARGRRIGVIDADVLGFGPDGSLLTAAGATFTGSRGGIEVRNPATLKLTRLIGYPRSLRGKGVANGVSFSKQGSRMGVLIERQRPTRQGPVTASASIGQYDYATGRRISPTTTVPTDTSGLAYTPDGRRLVVIALKATTVFDSRTGRRIRSYPVGGGAAALSPDGETLGIGGDDGSVRFLDLTTGKVDLGIGAQGGGTVPIGFTPDGKTLITSGNDGTTLLWDVDTHTVRETLAGHAGSIHAQAISANGSTLYTGSFDANVLGWDLTGRRGFVPSFVAADTDPNIGAWTLAVSPDSRTIAVGSSTGVVNLWDSTTLRKVQSFRAVPGTVAALSFGPDGRSLLVAGDTHQPRLAWLRIWRLGARPRLLRSLHGLQRITWATWSPDGGTVAASGRQLNQDPSKAGMVAEWDASTGRPLGPPVEIKGGGPVDVAFAPRGTTVAVSGLNGVAEVLDPAKRKVESRLTPRGEWTMGTAFSSDGSTLATTDWNGSLDLWDPQTGKMLGAPIPDPDQSVTNSVAWSPDGRTIAVTDWADTLRLFDVATRRELGPPLQLDNTGANTFPYAAYTPNGDSVVVADDTGRVWIFPASLKAWEDAACRVANRNFTLKEWQSFVSGHSYARVCPGHQVPR